MNVITKNKTIILTISVLFFFTACNKASNFNIPNTVSNDFNNFTTSITTSYIDSITKNNWLSEFEDEIKSENPNFVFTNTKFQYLLIPSLNIPVENISDFESDILNYLEKGSLGLNNSNFFVFRNDTLLLKFLVIDGISPIFDGLTKLDFSKIVNKTNIEVFTNSEIYFKISISGNGSTYHIPGIILKKGHTYHVMNSKGQILPIQDFHSLLFKNKEGMDKHIKRIINENFK